MRLRQIGGRGGIKAGQSVFDGVKPVTGNGFAGSQLNAEQQLRTQPLDRVTADGVDAWHGSAPTDALLFTHCGDHGLNLYFQSTSRRSRLCLQRHAMWEPSPNWRLLVRNE